MPYALTALSVREELKNTDEKILMGVALSDRSSVTGPLEVAKSYAVW